MILELERIGGWLLRTQTDDASKNAAMMNNINRYIGLKSSAIKMEVAELASREILDRLGVADAQDISTTSRQLERSKQNNGKICSTNTQHANITYNSVGENTTSTNKRQPRNALLAQGLQLGHGIAAADFAEGEEPAEPCDRQKQWHRGR